MKEPQVKKLEIQEVPVIRNAVLLKRVESRENNNLEATIYLSISSPGIPMMIIAIILSLFG